jgi:hypothetical protein
VKLASAHLEVSFAALCVIENHSSFRRTSMRTFTANIIILSAQVKDTTITGTAIDGDIAIEFAVANTDVNQRLFVPEAQLVVTGKFRIAKAIATVGAWISAIVAVVSIPAPAEVEVVDVPLPDAIAETAETAEVIEPDAIAGAAAREPEVSYGVERDKTDGKLFVEVEMVAEVVKAAPLTPAQKRAATLAAKKAAAAELVAC